ncbi:MAG: hypothetical protein WC595_04075 [Candidatus Nanoarchaeia archaeon]
MGWNILDLLKGFFNAPVDDNPFSNPTVHLDIEDDKGIRELRVALKEFYDASVAILISRFQHPLYGEVKKGFDDQLKKDYKILDSIADYLNHGPEAALTVKDLEVLERAKPLSEPIPPGDNLRTLAYFKMISVWIKRPKMQWTQRRVKERVEQAVEVAEKLERVGKEVKVKIAEERRRRLR